MKSEKIDGYLVTFEYQGRCPRDIPAKLAVLFGSKKEYESYLRSHEELASPFKPITAFGDKYPLYVRSAKHGPVQAN